MENVAEVMGAKYPQFNTISPIHTIQDALYQMCCENVDYLIVMDDQKFLGLLTEHDITHRILFDKRPLNEVCVKDFMSSRLPMANVSDSVEQCLQMLEHGNHKYLAVYDRFDFHGIISYYDLMQQVLRERKNLFEVKAAKEGHTWLY